MTYKLLISMMFVVSACGSDPNPDGGGGAGATGAGAGAGGDGSGGGATSSTTSTSTSSAVSTTSSGGMGGTCHELVNDAPAITVEQGAGPLPIPEGGVIHDGRYHLTSYVVYFDWSPPPTLENTIVIDGGLFDDVTSLARRQPGRALAIVAAAEAEVRRGLDDDAAWRLSVLRGEALRALGRDEEAIAAWRAAEDRLDEATFAVPLGEGRASFLAGREASAVSLVANLVAGERIEEAAGA